MMHLLPVRIGISWYITKILMSLRFETLVMQDYSGLELTPAKVRYLKYLSESGGRARVSEIAQGFGVDPSTVTRTVRELAREGFVVHERYGEILLTGFGSEYGAFLLRRHRILGLILSHYGLSGSEACDEASRIESCLSRNAVNKMCRSLGHPTEGLCGEICHDPLCRTWTGAGSDTGDESEAGTGHEKVSSYTK